MSQSSSSLGEACAQKGPEFRFVVSDGEYTATTLLKDAYNSLHDHYVPLETTSWRRFAWDVGVASKPLAGTKCLKMAGIKWLNLEKLAHWAVYITPHDTGETDSSMADPMSVPSGKYKTYGSNFQVRKRLLHRPLRQHLELEAVWPKPRDQVQSDDDDDWTRDLERGDFNICTHKNAPAPTVMYFSWPEFVLAAQFSIQQYIDAGFRERGLPEDANGHSLPNARVSWGRVRKHFKGLYTTGDAYDLTENNCQRFSRTFIEIMQRNHWTDTRRLGSMYSVEEQLEEFKINSILWRWESPSQGAERGAKMFEPVDFGDFPKTSSRPRDYTVQRMWTTSLLGSEYDIARREPMQTLEGAPQAMRLAATTEHVPPASTEDAQHKLIVSLNKVSEDGAATNILDFLTSIPTAASTPVPLPVLPGYNSTLQSMPEGCGILEKYALVSLDQRASTVLLHPQIQKMHTIQKPRMIDTIRHVAKISYGGSDGPYYDHDPEYGWKDATHLEALLVSAAENKIVEKATADITYVVGKLHYDQINARWKSHPNRSIEPLKWKTPMILFERAIKMRREHTGEWHDYPDRDRFENMLTSARSLPGLYILKRRVGKSQF